METATLSGPPRPAMVQPVQKSLSLPSYARASGEGIDHKLIFAALEQREKVRRKSKIFKEKEKTGTTRQNYFCLPLPSSKKCKETSLSSDTSCSSLEFQKPKCRVSPTKTTEDVPFAQNGILPNTFHPGKIDMNNNSDEGTCPPVRSVVSRDCTETTHKFVRTPRSTIGSSDSMELVERSSKSSTDSLSRKERLVAIKARVEAERERQLCHSSSDEEEEISLRITRHNSDGIIHRTVREVKTKSSKGDKRVKKRNPEEVSSRRAARRQHRSLYIPSTVDLENWKPPMVRSGSSFSLQRDLDDISKDFRDIENKQNYLISQSISGNSYFSDICSGDYKSRLVKPMVGRIEALEQRSLSKDITHHKNKALLNFENWRNIASDRKMCSSSPSGSQLFDTSKHSTPRSSSPLDIPKAPFAGNLKAPTPPPRSPKSTEIVNRAFMHHQHSSSANFFGESSSLERKRSTFQHKPSSLSITSTANSIEDFKKDLRNSRRKTCSNFSQIEQEISSETLTYNQTNKIPQQLPPRSPDICQKAPNIFRKTKLSDLTNSRGAPSPDMQIKRWEQIELDSEKKFNSLENRTSPCSESEWSKWKIPNKKKHSLSCFCPRSRQLTCKCFNPEQAFAVALNLQTEEEPNDFVFYKSNVIDKMDKTDVNVVSDLHTKLSSTENRNISCDCKTDLQFDTINREFINENLDTAMEELENVYRSLGISCEDLTTKTKLDFQPDVFCDTISKNRCDSDRSRLFDCNVASSPKMDKRSYSECENICYSLTPPPNTEEIKDALCIEELFGDLTQQLDIEQKLLEETKKKQRSSPIQATNLKQRTEYPYLHEINNKKDLTLDVANFPARNLTETSCKALVKKKHKAIRSLSENIASLMATESNRTFNSKDKTPDGTLEITNSKERKKRDEIWQIRVSMDPGKTPTEPPPASKATSSQLRLQSLLRKPNEDVIQKNQVSSLPSPREKTSRLSEGELEKLLSSLLNDVSNNPVVESKCNSDQQSNITSKGEMLVLQHLDVIRNCEPS